MNTDNGWMFSNVDGAIQFYGSPAYIRMAQRTADQLNYGVLRFFASASDATYGASATVQPKALNTQYLIRY